MTRATKNALALALGVALLSFAFGLPFLFDPCDWFDDGYMAIPGLRIRHGELPYRDFLLNVPPGSPYVHAFLQRTFGLDASVRRLYSFAEVSATIGILAWAARRFASARAVWLVGGVFALWSPATTTLLAHCNLDALLCSSAGLAIAIGGTGPSRRRLVLAGAVAGAGVWFKHSNALAAVAAAAAWLVPASPRRIRGTVEAKVLVLAGAVPVVLALVLWILANGVVE